MLEVQSKATLVVAILCVAIIWAVLPIFIPSERLLGVSITNLGYSPSCDPSWGLACKGFVISLRNLGPWPMSVNYASWEFHPHVEFPMGTGSTRQFLLAPFGAYTFSVVVYGGDVNFVTFSGLVTILYKTQRVTVDSAVIPNAEDR